MEFGIVRGECQGWVLSALSFQCRNTPWGNGIRFVWLKIIFFAYFIILVFSIHRTRFTKANDKTVRKSTTPLTRSRPSVPGRASQRIMIV